MNLVLEETLNKKCAENKSYNIGAKRVVVKINTVKSSVSNCFINCRNKLIIKKLKVKVNNIMNKNVVLK